MVARRRASKPRMSGAVTKAAFQATFVVSLDERDHRHPDAERLGVLVMAMFQS